MCVCYSCSGSLCCRGVIIPKKRALHDSQKKTGTHCNMATTQQSRDSHHSSRPGQDARLVKRQTGSCKETMCPTSSNRYWPACRFS